MLADIPENELTERIIGLAIEVHRTFGGPGLKENAYEAALEWKLKNAGLAVERQCRTYLKMLGLRVGLVLNLGRPTFKEGIDRVILDSEGGNRGIGLARGQT